jgi:hypothetical protein
VALNYVSLVCNYLDGQGYPVTSGTVTFTPNVVVTDTTSNVVITQSPVTVNLRLTPSPTMVLLATDNSGLTPSGWAWMIQPLFPGAPPGQLFLLPYTGGAVQYLADLLPAVAAPSVSTAYLPTAGGTVTGPAVFSGGLAIPTGAGSGDVLTSDSSGNAAWVAPGSSGLTTEIARAEAAEALKLSLVPAGVKTTAYTAVAADYVPVDTTGGNVTVTLPTAPPNLTLVGVKQVVQGGANTVTITCGGSAVFNKAGGGTSLTLALLNQGALLQYAATPGIWYVLADDLALSALDTRYSTPAALTAAVGVESTRATTAEGLLAPKASPALTGTPTAPTAAALTSSTALATTAYADTAVGVEKTRAQIAEALALPLTGGTMTGAITLPGNPSSALQSAPKQYVDAVASGLAVKPSVQEATTAALAANTYSAGVLTATGNGVLTVDGVTVALGDRILVQNETATANNGIYTVTTLGTSGVPYVLTRAADMNTGGQVPGAFTFCEQGTANAGAGFTVAGTGPYTLGTTGIPWTQFSGAGEVTAGTGLGKTGNTVSLTVPVAVTSGGTGATSAGAALTSLGAAPLASPALTGTPTAPTPSALTASTVLATTAYADSATGVETSRATTAEALLAPLAAKNTFSMDQYFKSGKPWFDVCAYGADPAGVADSTAAFQAAINAACNLRTDTNVGFTAASTTVTNPAAVSGDNGKYLTSQNFPRVDTSCSTNTTTTVTDAWAQYSDLGCTITGTGIPAATTITAVSNGVGYTISNAATATASGLTFTVIGGSGGYAHITAVTPGVGYTVSLAATATLSAQTATVGTSATLSGRNAVGPVYIPAGLYLISSDLLIRSVLGFRMQGAGADQVRLAPVGTGFTQAIIFIDGSLDGVFEGFNIQGNGTEGAAGSTNPGILHAIRLDWTKAASRSTSANHFRNIRIRATNFVTGLSAEGTLARQVDGTYLHDVLVTGLQTAGSWLSTGNWQAGFAFGNGTQGNIYDHVAVACGASNCYYNFKVNCSSIALFGAQPGANGIDYYLQNPTSQCTVENVQSQNSGQLIVCAGNASIVPVSFRDIQYKPYVGRADTGLCGTNSTTTVTDTAAVAGDLNKPICGPGIPLGATITAVTPTTGYTISAAATATASSITFTVGFNPTWISTGTSYGSWVLENIAYTPAGTVATPPIISLGTGHGSYGQQFTLIGVSQPAPPSTGITTGTSVPVIAIAYSDISAGQGPGLTATYPFYARNAGVLFQQGLSASRPASAATYGEMWYWATDTAVLSHSNGTAWTTVNVATSGTATGDLSGSYPGPTVAKLNGVTISNAPTTGQALLATGTTAAAWSTFSAGVTIDTTSADIQPLGTKSYGNPATGLAADSGHVHPTPTAPDIQVFSANGTWNKVAGVQTVQLMMIGSGGGGGGGHRGPSTSAACGGGGGGGGGLLIRQFAAADLPTSVTVTIGAGGASGGAATSDASNGGNGGGGGYTYFVGYASLIGGGAGNGGTTSAGAAGAVGPGSSVGGIGAAASTSGGAGLGGQPGAGGGGGGSGGGLVITTPVATLGGAGGYSWSSWNSNVGVVGAVDSTSPTAGTLPTVKGNPSCGGAGGCSSTTTVAQNGATAYIGGGGGGGGASVNGNNSGAGGVGGPGYVMVISYYQ